MLGVAAAVAASLLWALFGILIGPPLYRGRILALPIAEYGFLITLTGLAIFLTVAAERLLLDNNSLTQRIPVSLHWMLRGIFVLATIFGALAG